jgi:O-antigen ligase
MASWAAAGLIARMPASAVLDPVAAGFALGALVAAFAVLFASRDAGFENADLASALASAQRTTAGAADPNDLALALTPGLLILLSAKRPLLKGLAIVPAVALLYTGSRGGVLAASTGILALVVLTVLRRVRRKADERIKANGTHILAYAAIFLIGAVWLSTVRISDQLITRFSTIPAELEAGSLTNRRVLWSAAWDAFNDRPLFGTGAGTSPEIIRSATNFDLVPHNIHLTFLVELGLAGWLPFGVALVAAVVSSYKARDQILWLFPSVMAVTIGTTALSWDRSKLLWLLLVAAVAARTITRAKPDPAKGQYAQVDVRH